MTKLTRPAIEWAKPAKVNPLVQRLVVLGTFTMKLLFIINFEGYAHQYNISLKK